jgi:DNA-binding NtrC family response regulator
VWVTSPERAMDVLLTDVTFEGGAAGRLLDWVAGRDPGLPCLIATRRPDLAVRRYLPKNVQRVLLKPIDEDVLVGCLERAVRARGVAPGIVQARPPSEAPPRRASAVACSTRLGGALRAAGAK